MPLALVFISSFPSFAMENYLKKITDSDGSLKRLSELKILKVGADPNLGMPYLKQENKNNFKGFEIDVSNYIAENFDCTSKIIPTNWENLFLGLEQKKYDIVISAIEEPEKKLSKYQNISFSKPYYINSYHIVTKKESKNIRIITDLKNKKVGIIDNSFGEVLISEINKQKKYNINKIKYNSIDELFSGLEKNLVDSIIIDTPIATWKCENENINCKKIGLPIYSKGYVIAIRKEDKSLVNAIDMVLSESKKNKKLNEIISKWNLD
ncbi:MAG: ABC transporter substrate-binding protein [Cyanobacteriota bacterium]